MYSSRWKAGLFRKNYRKILNIDICIVRNFCRDFPKHKTEASLLEISVLNFDYM